MQNNNNSIHIKKRGGDNAAKLRENSRLIIEDFKKGISQALVLSAMRDDEFNTTDKLIEIGTHMANGDLRNSLSILDKIKDFHFQTIKNELANQEDTKNNTLKQLNKLFNDFAKILTLWNNAKDKDNSLPIKANDYSIKLDNQSYSIIGFGEVLSAKLNELVLNQKAKLTGVLGTQEKFAEAVDLNHLLDPEESKGKSEREIFAILFQKLSEKVDLLIKNNIIPILPGYVGVFPNGIENAVGRGYTDATAGALAVGLKKKNKEWEVVLKIQKAVKGILSSDPRILQYPDAAKKIEHLDYLFARELIGARGAQAKVLHHQSMRGELLTSGIKIHLHNPFDPENNGTRITPDGDNKARGVQYVGGRTNVTFVTISGDNMGQGYLDHVMEVVSKYVSIDIVSTSETEIAFTYDCSDKDQNACFQDLISELKEKYDFNGHKGPKINFVKTYGDKALLFCIGQNMKGLAGLSRIATRTLARKNINLEISSQGIQERAMIFGIESKHLHTAIQDMHREFIEKPWLLRKWTVGLEYINKISSQFAKYVRQSWKYKKT